MTQLPFSSPGGEGGGGKFQGAVSSSAQVLTCLLMSPVGPELWGGGTQEVMVEQG